MAVLTPDAKFKIGIATAAAFCVACIGFGWRAQQTLGAIEKRLDSMASRMDTMETTIGDRFAKTAAAEWALRLQIKNPTISIPDPRSPNQLLKDN